MSEYCRQHRLSRQECWEDSDVDSCPYCQIDKLTAELAEAKKSMERSNKEWEKLCWSAQDKYAEWKVRAEKLEAELSRYREALERISLRDRYGTTGHMVYGECGKVALKALAKEEI